MALRQINTILFLDKFLKTPGVRTGILYLLLSSFLFLCGNLFYSFIYEYSYLEKELSYYANWQNEKMKLGKELQRLRSISSNTGKQFYSKTNDNIYYAQILKKAKNENIFIEQWKNEKEKISANSISVPLKIRASGNPQEILSFLHFLESAGNPIIFEQIQIINTEEDPNKISLLLSMEVIFKNG